MIIPRAGHVISRANISPNAVKVLYRLSQAGYQAYLVGGGVRDLLLGREPKDFDVATDARPDQVRELFRNCRLIGRRFRLAHVHFGREIIEVATFRGGSPEAAPQLPDDDGPRAVEEDGRLLRDNVYGTLEEDVWRRDFTVNALYYNIDGFSVADYAGGMEDLRAGVLRLIGDPEQRYREDPVRMLRAVRFAAKLGFRIDPGTADPIPGLAALLDDIPPARLFEEVLKLFLAGYALQTFELLRHYGLFAHLFPETDACLAREESGFPLTFVSRALANTDTRIAAGKPVTPVFLCAALLWEPVRRQAVALRTEDGSEGEALQRAGDAVVARQLSQVSLPRRITLPMREIWQLQSRLAQRRGKRSQRLLQHPRFRAAYDFLLLRAEEEEGIRESAEWWTQIQELPASEPAPAAEPGRRRRRRSRRRGGRTGGDPAGAGPGGE
ncbi:MAG: polynucleotide adenylyltransferase PcnB [Gammaproteobacteria bacterium]